LKVKNTREGYTEKKRTTRKTFLEGKNLPVALFLQSLVDGDLEKKGQQGRGGDFVGVDKEKEKFCF